MSTQSTKELPEEKDFIRVTYETDRGRTETAKGVVSDVEDDNPSGKGVDLHIVAQEPLVNTELLLSFGREEVDGEIEKFGHVHRRSPYGSGPTMLGEEVTYEIL